MLNLTESVEGIYVLIAVYITACIIIITILIIELFDWYLATRTKPNTTKVSAAIEMSITMHNSKNGSKSTEHSSSKPDPYIRILPISMYILWICNATATTLSRLAVGIYHDCDYLGLIDGSFFVSAKCCLYLVLLYRLYKVYSGSVFQKNTTVLKIAAALTILWAIFVLVCDIFTIRRLTVIIDDTLYCVPISSPFVVLFMLIYDMSLNIGCCYAFTRPLLWLSKKRRSREENGIFDAVVRYIVLTVVEVISTFMIAVLAILLQSNDLFIMDMAMNSLCIMLFNGSYRRFYHCICCGAHTVGYKVIKMECCCGQKESDEQSKDEGKQMESVQHSKDEGK